MSVNSQQAANQDPARLPAERGLISGFSKLNKEEKLQWLTDTFFQDSEAAYREIETFWHPDRQLQRTLDGFSENTLSNFPMPYGVVPNMLINGRIFAVPMVIEESSVVAAASAAAKYWAKRGGFRAEVSSTVKLGQLHFRWSGRPQRIPQLLPNLEARLRRESADLTANMEARGGGILGMDWLHLPQVAPDYYQLLVRFETCDSMGANFINSVLERFGRTLTSWAVEDTALEEQERRATVIMAILSNYTPECVVRSWVECPVDQLGPPDDPNIATFTEQFRLAVRIAEEDTYRAVTHNKGILNGIDAVILATANDFRAVEACVHAYAARDGKYRSLSHCTVEGGLFRFELTIPLAVGTVGGLTRLHPLAKRSLELLGQPSAPDLMKIVAATGLAQNFAAVRSLVTTGIQRGHMKMHLMNILQHLNASEAEATLASGHFAEIPVSYQGVRTFLAECRKSNPGQ